MAKPYSDDLRERVARAVEAGSSRHQAAAQFDVSVSFVVKLMQRFRATGSLRPGELGGRSRPKLGPHEAIVREFVAQSPSATLRELGEKLRERGVVVGKSSIDRFLKQLRISFKKNAPRGRTTTRGRRRRPRRVATDAVDARSAKARLRRRNLGFHQHDAPLWTLREGQAIDRPRAFWARENHDLHRGAST